MIVSSNWKITDKDGNEIYSVGVSGPDCNVLHTDWDEIYDATGNEIDQGTKYFIQCTCTDNNGNTSPLSNKLPWYTLPDVHGTTVVEYEGRNALKIAYYSPDLRIVKMGCIFAPVDPETGDSDYEHCVNIEATTDIHGNIYCDLIGFEPDSEWEYVAYSYDALGRYNVQEWGEGGWVHIWKSAPEVVVHDIITDYDSVFVNLTAYTPYTDVASDITVQVTLTNPATGEHYTLYEARGNNYYNFRFYDGQTDIYHNRVTIHEDTDYVLDIRGYGPYEMFESRQTINVKTDVAPSIYPYLYCENERNGKMFIHFGYVGTYNDAVSAELTINDGSGDVTHYFTLANSEDMTDELRGLSQNQTVDVTLEYSATGLGGEISETFTYIDPEVNTGGQN